MSASMTRAISAATPPAPVNAPASRCGWLPNSYGWPWSSSFEPWTSNHQLDTPNFRTIHRILNSWLTYFSASFIFYGSFFNWLCQTLRHPSWVTSGHAMQWKRLSPPFGGLTWGNSLTVSELDLVSPDLIWGTIIVYSSLESSQSDSCLPFNVSLHYFPSSSLCFRHAGLPALPKSQQLCSFMPRASARTAVFCLKCFSFLCPPGELLPFFMSQFKSSLP